MIVVCICSEDSEESGEPNYLELDDASGYLTFHKVKYCLYIDIVYLEPGFPPPCVKLCVNTK